jgi:alkylation response protein AidB-like acyl-CoA dehydrogenase
MDLNYSPEEQAFRAEVRAFAQKNVPVALREKVEGGKRLTRDDLLAWHKILHAKGWIGYSWPPEFGGTGWSAIQQHIFDEECAAAGAPMLLPFGLHMVGPVIMKFGSPAQQQRFLPRILAGEDWWCQGYSEPGAGSDLASLKTRAELRGDHYVVNGQKTWTTLAQHADWMFCLVRTSSEGRPQQGISFLLIDMKSPGITVRPIIMIDGEHEINEVWLEDVEVPLENRIGEENKGWTYAKYLLGHERTFIAQVGRSKQGIKHLKQIAWRERANGRPLIEDARFRDKLAQVEIDLLALEMTLLRVISEEGKGRTPGPEASLLKIKGTDMQQTIFELQMLAAGHYALPYTPEALDYGWHGEPVGADYVAGLTGEYFNQRKATIYGGSNEIQKNIIAQMILGL